ncbi:MAG: GNAT family N-acetyltransferase [Gemmatimonadales bacterium]
MRRPEQLAGPARARVEDIEAINGVFSEAFTDRYQRDGMSGVRVPRLNPAIWRFAIAAAGEGAMIWRDRGGAGTVIAFNMAHHCGAEGWMGPLAVRPSHQGRGVGGLIVATGIQWLRDRGAQVIGLETMPRTVENIGFYSRLGFRPEHLTVSVARELPTAPPRIGTLLSREGVKAGIAECRELIDRLAPGTDFSREIALTLEHGLGDVTLLRDRTGLAGFALWHCVPLAEGRPLDEVRVLKLAARSPAAFRRLVQAIEWSGWARGSRRIGIRCQTAYRATYGALLDAGFRVHWTDLRMTLDGQPEAFPRGEGVVFSNWEI